MEAFERVQILGRDRQAHAAAAEDLFEQALVLVQAARDEGYSVEAIARALGVTRQTLYSRLRGPTT